MKEIIITSREAGQRLDKYLGKYLREAPKSFIYKMLRKKNITLNGKKADGSEKVQEQDVVRLYFAEDTLNKFTGIKEKQDRKIWPCRKLDIIYEDEQVCLINKPAGMLSQKAKPEDVSLVEYFIGYLLQSGQITEQELARFQPSVCNRLDRNTSGIVAAGKTMAGLQELSRLFHDRTMHKYYRCLVKGQIAVSAVSQDHFGSLFHARSSRRIWNQYRGLQETRPAYPGKAAKTNYAGHGKIIVPESDTDYILI